MTQGRILVVDDDRDFVQAVAAVLERQGYEVLCAYDGRTGVLRALREAPDLILVDVMMDERTEGFFVVQELRRLPALEGVPIFVVSAVYEQIPEFQVPPDPAWLPYDSFLRKPIDPKVLLDRIREALAVLRAAPPEARP